MKARVIKKAEWPSDYNFTCDECEQDRDVLVYINEDDPGPWGGTTLCKDCVAAMLAKLVEAGA